MLRETYRKRKELVYDAVDTPYVFMISYIGKDEPSYSEVELKMEKLLQAFVEKIHQ